MAGTIRIADWSSYQTGARSLFGRRYDAGTTPHSHVHGANLGFRAAAYLRGVPIQSPFHDPAYLRADGFPDVPTGEDRALVTA